MSFPEHIRAKYPELTAGSMSDQDILHSMGEQYKSPQLNVLNEEWEVLIILDACRYDLFKKHNFIEGQLESRYSLGCCTPEWVKNTFRRNLRDIIFQRSRNFKDIVYVSGNPFISSFMLQEIIGNPNPFHEIKKVWNYGWDEEVGTVLPDTLTQEALSAVEEHPEKRVIVHYMQPHAPYLSFNKAYKEVFGWKTLRSDILSNTKPELSPRGGEVSLKEIIQSYIDNLTIVLKSITGFKELDKIVRVTADHGECLGEFVPNVGRKVVGHPPGIDIRALREVPWFLMRTRHPKSDPEYLSGIGNDLIGQQKASSSLRSWLGL